MKTLFFKIAMPITAAVMAVGSSFITHASEKSVNGPVVAYINPLTSPPTLPCTINVTCSNIQAPVVCTAFYQGISYQAFSKASPNDTFCEIVRYKWPVD